MNKHDNNKLFQTEDGMVSIIVTMIIMIVLSLIVMGFAQLSRREQRMALDRQLSTQAFYAAESGINDAIKAIKGGNTNDKRTCPPDLNYPSLLGTVSGNASYTCLLIDQKVNSLEYGNVLTNESTIIPITATANIKSLTISWHSDGSDTFTSLSLGDFPASAAGLGDTGMLRVSLTPTGGATDFYRDNLNKDTFTTFLYPKAYEIKDNGASIPYSDQAKDQGNVVNGRCHKDNTDYHGRYCNVTIINLEYLTQRKFFIRLKSIYKDTSVMITGKDTTDNPLTFIGTQAMIDSTGKAGDVLRRVQVRVPLGGSYSGPEYAVQSVTGICKLYSVWPDGGADDGSCL